MEEQTKIRRKYLVALEDENFDLLPGRVYVKGFLKNYAAFLGLNPRPLIAAYEEKVPPPERDEDPVVEKYTHFEKTNRRNVFKTILALAVLASVAALAYQPLQPENRKNVPPAVPENNVVAEKRTPPEEKTGQGENKTPPKEQQGVRITLSVTDNESWMRVEVDGKQAFEGLVPAGQMKEFKGNEKITLRLGNAGVVQVEFNGQKMGVLGGHGQVVTREFTAPQG